MADPVTLTLGHALLIGGATAAAGTGLSMMQAKRQNEALAASQQAEVRKGRVAQQQIANAAGVEKTKQVDMAQQIRGRLRVAAAASGGAFGGSFQSLDRQAVFDSGFNQAVTRSNAALQNKAARSGVGANLTALEGQKQNLLLSGLTGGLQGFGTGLSIASGLKAFEED